MQYICCADLNLTGTAAGTHFFQHNPSVASNTVELACIQLDNADKIRLIQLPKSEYQGVEQTIRQNWPHSVISSAKYGVDVFKLGNSPWASMETSKDGRNVAARKLLMKILSHMDCRGWNRVVPFMISFSDHTVDSLLFFREGTARVTREQEFIAVSLESQHKIRLIGGDETTQAAFQNAATVHWKGVRETNRFADNLQVKFNGNPWTPQTTPENISSARLVCGILQSLWDNGWRWHCAVDLSIYLADKSTFFLTRNATHGQIDGFRGGSIACVQPKGSGKVNLVSFPPSILNRVVINIQSVAWYVPLLKVENHGNDCATVHFQCRDLHRSQRTDEKLATAKVYTQLLKVVALAASGIAMLGTADISANFNRDSNGHRDDFSLDTNVFFLWMPSKN